MNKNKLSNELYSLLLDLAYEQYLLYYNQWNRENHKLNDKDKNTLLSRLSRRVDGAASEAGLGEFHSGMMSLKLRTAWENGEKVKSSAEHQPSRNTFGREALLRPIPFSREEFRVKYNSSMKYDVTPEENVLTRKQPYEKFKELVTLVPRETKTQIRKRING